MKGQPSRSCPLFPLDDHAHRLIPLTTKSTSRPPHSEQTNCSRQSRTGVSAPCRCASWAGSGSTWCPHYRRQTISRVRLAPHCRASSRGRARISSRRRASALSGRAHSITSSARGSRVGGIVSPSALAVLDDASGLVRGDRIRRRDQSWFARPASRRDSAVRRPCAW
jgi:hypothetical protein